MTPRTPATDRPTDELVYRACVDRIGRHATADPSALGEPVRACPGWSGRDVLGHLTGIAADWVSGNLDGYATPAWTAAQVGGTAGLDLPELLAAWRRSVDRLAGAPPHRVLGAPWRWLAGDALCHEADLAESLAWPAVPTGAVQAGLDAAIPRWRAVHDTAGAPPLEVQPIGHRPRRVGARVDDGVPVATVTVEPAELWRALYGRRSRSEVERWDWSEDPTPWLDAGLAFPFTFAAGPPLPDG